MKTKRERAAQGSLDDFIEGATASKAEEIPQEKKPLGRPPAQDKELYSKSTFVIRKDLQKKVRVAAALAGVEQRQILEEALTEYLAKMPEMSE